IDSYQIYESKMSGADAILLIVRMLTKAKLDDLLGLARELGLFCLVEAHDEQEMELALDCQSLIVGINARNLQTFQVDLSAIERVAKLVPADRILVAESGIQKREDVIRVQKAGAKAVLVGTRLMTSSDNQMIRKLVGA
ncbi:MAG TPA: indole-3-glycerol-phosphate synthase, partial [Candidatus Wirthbacteria bacterium]|nr:indole-3-glycerol-phosphate synthase [Candidatus Wirthbacteria bacterium]